jgi:hypothetical protein
VSDAFELLLAMDLGDDLTGAEVDELRWHLGLGPQPARLTVVPGFPEVVVDDDGRPRVVDAPRPLLAATGPAHHRGVGGALVSALARREDPAGWALTSRQELHPDDFELVRTLLGWLAQHCDPASAGRHGHPIGHLRFHEDIGSTPLTTTAGGVDWPAD